MKLTLIHAFVALLGFLVVNLTPLHAADATKAKGMPGRGTVSAVDASANTVTLEGKKGDRVFSVTPTTKISDGAGKTLTLADIKAGDKVGIYYTKDAAGKMTLETLNLHGAEAAAPKKATTAAAAPTTSAPAPSAPATPPPAKTPAAAAPEKSPATTAAPAAAPTAKAKSQKIAGKVISVDAAGGSIVIHGKSDYTCIVPADAKITGAANLGAITAGQHVSATIVKNADGSMTASAIKVDK